MDFPSGPVLKNPPTTAGNKGLIPGQGRSHLPGTTKPLSHNYGAHTP